MDNLGPGFRSWSYLGSFNNCNLQSVGSVGYGRGRIYISPCNELWEQCFYISKYCDYDQNRWNELRTFVPKHYTTEWGSHFPEFVIFYLVNRWDRTVGGIKWGGWKTSGYDRIYKRFLRFLHDGICHMSIFIFSKSKKITLILTSSVYFFSSGMLFKITVASVSYTHLTLPTLYSV